MAVGEYNDKANARKNHEIQGGKKTRFFQNLRLGNHFKWKMMDEVQIKGNAHKPV